VAVSSPPGAFPAQSKGNNMTAEMIWGVIRTILASIMGYLAGKGYFDAETGTAIVGAIGTLFVAAWSIFSKKK
jgi:ABC-type Mn2+/Zn2+ transport system permease subunit